MSHRERCNNSDFSRNPFNILHKMSYILCLHLEGLYTSYTFCCDVSSIQQNSILVLKKKILVLMKKTTFKF
jgi:hypothetical protein